MKNSGSETGAGTGAGGGLETGIVSAANVVPPFSDPCMVGPVHNLNANTGPEPLQSWTCVLKHLENLTDLS